MKPIWTTISMMEDILWQVCNGEKMSEKLVEHGICMPSNVTLDDEIMPTCEHRIDAWDEDGATYYLIPSPADIMKQYK